ncbi:MAG TPA: NAD(P)/FAD-dependent oxidoreductase [Acidimicrobiales bacterium]|nr:NAD(P)/FAD-dependent oxidoreductase [Acidimicrobiales bacterium]
MYDAIVVGARCGGSATALLLARRGRSVLLVDRATFPSDTFSTHFVDASGAALLDRWGAVPRLERLGVPFFGSVELNVAGNRMQTSELFGSRLVCSPRRTDLDSVLCEMAAEAGAEVRMQTSVAEVVRDNYGRVTGVRLRSEDGTTKDESAAVVVGADGRTSVVARTVQPVSRDEHTIRGNGFYAYFDDFEYATPSAGFFDNSFVFAFPTAARSACIGTEIDAANDVRSDPEAVFFDRLGADDDLCQRVKAATRESRWHVGELPAGWLRHAGGAGWALVGDAACTKDPLLGHGITDAFIGAELLAVAIDRGLSEGDLDAALARYDDALFEHLGPIYEASREPRRISTSPVTNSSPPSHPRRC